MKQLPSQKRDELPEPLRDAAVDIRDMYYLPRQIGNTMLQHDLLKRQINHIYWKGTTVGRMRTLMRGKYPCS